MATTNRLMIDPTEAMALSKRSSLAWLDCRFSLFDYGAGRTAWRRLRIPGAAHMDMERDLAGHCSGHNGRHPLPTRAAFESSLQRAGVNAGDTIILYDDQSLAGAARAWWLLRYFGIHDVRLLNGGLKGWRDSGLAVAVSTPELPNPGNITLRAGDSRMIVGINTVVQLSMRGSKRIIDAREPARFRGEFEPIDPVAGRIPGARNIPWNSVFGRDGRVRSDAALRHRWRHLPATVTPIVYCGSGVTASVNLLSLQLAGRHPGKLYPGSFSEWCADPRRHIARDSDTQ